MAGTLKKVGEGGWTANDVAEALEARDRARCGPVAPPQGLYLAAVEYPQEGSGGGKDQPLDEEDDGE